MSQTIECQWCVLCNGKEHGGRESLITAQCVMLPPPSQDLTTESSKFFNNNSKQAIGRRQCSAGFFGKVPFLYLKKKTIFIISHKDRRWFDLLLKIKVFDINTLRQDKRQILWRFSVSHFSLNSSRHFDIKVKADVSHWCLCVFFSLYYYCKSPMRCRTPLLADQRRN